VTRCIRTIKQIFLSGWTDIMTFSIVAVISGLVGIIITLCILRFNQAAESYVQIGALLAMLLGLAIFIFGEIFSLANEFNLAVSMGICRKYFLPAKYLMFSINIVATLIIAMILGEIEKRLYPAIYPDLVCALNVNDFLLHPIAFGGIIFGGAMLILVFGALVLRFSTKVFWVIWALWMISTMSFSKIASAINHAEGGFWKELGDGILQLLQNMSAGQIGLIVLGLTALGYGIAYALLRKQRVTL